MTHAEIVSRLSRLIESPSSDVLYSITMQHVLTTIAHRMGDDTEENRPYAFVQQAHEDVT